MGYVATNYLPHDISKKLIIEFIKELGYRGKGNEYYFIKDEDYKSFMVYTFRFQVKKKTF